MEKLTIQEEEAMQVIWKVGPGFIKDFLDELPGPKVPYTTFASTVRKLEKKGFVLGVKFANAFRYEPIISEVDYKKRFMHGFVSDYFKNSYKDLVSFFAKEKKITAEELDEVLRMIKEGKSQ